MMDGRTRIFVKSLSRLKIEKLFTFCCIGETSISTGRVGVETASKSKLVTSRFPGDSDTLRDWDRKD